MDAASARDTSFVLPDGYAIVPLGFGHDGADTSVLRYGLVFRREAEGSAGHFVRVRDWADVQAYLGGVLDHGGRVQQWVEYWVQSTAVSDIAAPADIDPSMMNSARDGRWQRLVKALDQSAPPMSAGAFIRSGWEDVPQVPVPIDVKRGVVVPLPDSKGGAWEVCRDDAMLKASGLPAYGTSSVRHLSAKGEGGAALFISLSPNQQSGSSAAGQGGASVRTLRQLVENRPEIAVFNPGGGAILVRRHVQLRLEDYLDALTKGDGQVAREAVFTATGGGRSARSEAGGAGEGWLFLGSPVRGGRLLETLHLKLRAIADAIAGVSEQIRASGQPLLNLSLGSFRVQMGEPGQGLPYLWTAKTILSDPGNAIEVFAGGGGAGAPCYACAGKPDSTIFLPAAAHAQGSRGRASLRLRQRVAAGGGAVFEGTLVSQERIEPAPSDLFVIYLNLPTGRVTLHGRLERQAELADGTWRLRTLPRAFSAAESSQLEAVVGVPLNDVLFEHLPLLTSPVDLYSLGVLAVRSLLVNAKTSLPMSLDAVGTLAGHLSADANRAKASLASIGQRVSQVLGQNPGLLASLGPDKLIDDFNGDARSALDMVPLEVWAEVLGVMVKMFPGKGSLGECRDFGDAPAGGLHKIFATSLNELERLIRRTRSSIVIDWRSNREVHAIVRGLLTGMSGSGSSRSATADGRAARKPVAAGAVSSEVGTRASTEDDAVAIGSSSVRNSSKEQKS